MDVARSTVRHADKTRARDIWQELCAEALRGTSFGRRPIVALSPGPELSLGAGRSCSRPSQFHERPAASVGLGRQAGGAFPSIDSPDFFSEEERHTVVDLAPDAAKIRGISVIVTACQDFDADEPNWLPSNALDALVRPDPVPRPRTSDDEPAICGRRRLHPRRRLADGHPARAVGADLPQPLRLAKARRCSAAPYGGRDGRGMVAVC